MLIQPHNPHNSQYIVRPPARSDAWEDHYVRAVQLENWRRQQFLLLLADRLVFTLSDAFTSKLGAATTARSVMISAERQRHILGRRAVVSELDADLAARRIHEALEDYKFLMPPKKPNIYKLIGFASSADRLILVALSSCLLLIRKPEKTSGGFKQPTRSARRLSGASRSKAN